MSKCVRDGKIAILYSPGYGAGWSSWNSEEYKEFLLHDEKLVELVESGQQGKVNEYVQSVYPEGNICTLGAKDLEIAWVEPGTQFRIEEYDGSERIEFNRQTYWNVA